MISVNATLDAELDSLLRRPATAFTARRFMPVWTQEIAAGATQYAMGHSA
ncbi:MAG: hypothetical protein GY796_25325, partial [Chloroflexi bacterium]|nr:hypothetical protein [Chloroflexota bacterium]